MGMKELKKALMIIKSHDDDADFEGEKPVIIIEAAEKTLGVTFPPSYREFLRVLGCGDIYGEEFFGIIKEDFADSGIPDAVWLTLKYRRELDLPWNYVIVYGYGDGSYAVIDTGEKDEEQESPVLLWSPVSPGKGEFEKVSSDFGIFLKNAIEAAIR